MKADNNNDLETYWSKRYLDQSTGWDLGHVSEPIRCYVDQLKNKDIKILVPGAGNAYEAEYLYRSGFKNTYIVDISELPLNSFKDRVSDFPSKQIIHNDFFKLDSTFDLIIEQTFMCSFPPVDTIRPQYIKKMYDLLNANGKLVGLWFDIPLSGDLEKRPFGGTKSEYVALFSTYFKIKTLEEAYNSVSSRKGQELFGVLEKRS
ncbi:methyltransferase domain-containing protein [Flavivirga jejuensis]|uniref:SAM-dependent methyltransferase n=1 Tax=Flavivirga jejuensis TaxID=870487 RepID=A0ABT8WQ26_9FLAO|nr:methyltransferase domain-containing protein [Flavivirga jejuensis]MDO5975246.1 SAM-dependent methyltransferase [Flavivirga jejuensis]